MTTPPCPRCGAPLTLYFSGKVRCSAGEGTSACRYGIDAPRTLVPQPDPVAVGVAPRHRFVLTYRNGAYYVSEPGLPSPLEVVDAAAYDALCPQPDTRSDDGWPAPLNIPDTPENRARGRRGLEYLTGGAVSMWADDAQPAPTPQRTDAGGVAPSAPRDLLDDVRAAERTFYRLFDPHSDGGLSEPTEFIAAELTRLGWHHDAQPAPTPQRTDAGGVVGISKGARLALTQAVVMADAAADSEEDSPSGITPDGFRKKLHAALAEIDAIPYPMNTHPAPTPQRTDAGDNDGWPAPLNIPDTPENRARGRRGLEYLTGGAVSMWADDAQPAPTPQRTDAGGVAECQTCLGGKCITEDGQVPCPQCGGFPTFVRPAPTPAAQPQHNAKETP